MRWFETSPEWALSPLLCLTIDTDEDVGGRIFLYLPLGGDRVSAMQHRFPLSTVKYALPALMHSMVRRPWYDMCPMVHSSCPIPSGRSPLSVC